MKISREGVLLIKSFEGFRPRAVLRADGRWVVGYGHTACAREGTRVSEADAELLLQYDLIPVRSALVESLSQPVNQHQFDALASFAFSVGIEAFSSSEVAARINAGDLTDAANAMAAWPELAVRDAGLHRRAAERALFVASPGVAVTLADLLCAPLPEPSAEASPGPATAAANDSLPAAAAAQAETLAPAGTGPVPADLEPAAVEPAPDDVRKADTPGSGPNGATSVPVTEIQTPESLPGPDARAEPEAKSDTLLAKAVAVPVTDATAANQSPEDSTVQGEAERPEPAAEGPAGESQAEEATATPLETSPSTPPLRETEAALSSGAMASFAGSAVHSAFGERASTYAATGTGSLPGDHSGEASTGSTEPDPTLVADPFTGAVSGAAEPRPGPIIWPPRSDEQAATGQLRVTGAVAEGSALSSPRLVWPGDENTATSKPTVLPAEEGVAERSSGTRPWTDRLEGRPTRFSWRRVWGFLLMGSFGLISLAMAMAALRKASLATSEIQSFLAIAAVLAIIGIACVGVSAYNIYQRLSDDR